VPTPRQQASWARWMQRINAIGSKKAPAPDAAAALALGKAVALLAALEAQAEGVGAQAPRRSRKPVVLNEA
jgi:hypothetical protein